MDLVGFPFVLGIIILFSLSFIIILGFFLCKCEITHVFGTQFCIHLTLRIVLQIHDTGIIEGPDGAFEVSNVQIYGGFVIHIGSFRGKTGRLYLGDKVVCKVIHYFMRKDLIMIVQIHTN